MTGVLDFGIGNIASILNMIECVHGKGMAVHTAEELALCKRLILPGVGAFDAGMSLLNLSGMRNALDKAVANGIPLLGICLGMQMLGLSSEEGDAQGLGYIPFRLLSWLVLHSFHQTERARKAICAMIFFGNCIGSVYGDCILWIRSRSHGHRAWGSSRHPGEHWTGNMWNHRIMHPDTGSFKNPCVWSAG